MYKKNIKTFFFKSCCGPENAMKRFGDKDKVAADECYAQVAEKFATVTGKLNDVQNWLSLICIQWKKNILIKFI